MKGGTRDCNALPELSPTGPLGQSAKVCSRPPGATEWEQQSQRVHDSPLRLQRLRKRANLSQLRRHRLEPIEVGQRDGPLAIEHRSDPS
jgi:hypothetical protein